MLSRLLEWAGDGRVCPAGHYARVVAEAASASGIRTLFTSEPVLSVRGRRELSRLRAVHDSARRPGGDGRPPSPTRRLGPRARQYALLEREEGGEESRRRALPPPSRTRRRHALEGAAATLPRVANVPSAARRARHSQSIVVRLFVDELRVHDDRCPSPNEITARSLFANSPLRSSKAEVVVGDVSGQHRAVARVVATNGPAAVERRDVVHDDDVASRVLDDDSAERVSDDGVVRD